MTRNQWLKLCVTLTLIMTLGGFALIVGRAQAQKNASSLTLTASTLGTAFTYQGRLTDGGSPANGAYDFQFELYDAATSGSPVGSISTQSDVTVTDGLFTVTLDFGSVFDGTALWLKIRVRPGSSIGSYSELTPRQALTAVPYALSLQPGATIQHNASGYALGIGGGNWDPNTSQGDLRIGDDVYRLKIAVATAGGGAGDARLRAQGGTDRMLLGGGTNDVLTITSNNVGIGTITPHVTSTLHVETGGERAIYGNNIAVSGTAYGVYAKTASTDGTGVYGYASAASGPALGVLGQTNSPLGNGVSGIANATSGSSIGTYGRSYSPNGYGIYGYASDASGTDYGVYGLSAGATGRGVYGEASDASGSNYGVFGISHSSSGQGVHGVADATTGNAYGVKGESWSTTGRGVYGIANTTSGVNYGVYGVTNSSAGYAGYFSGNVHVNGTLSKSAGSFRIDHPLDPANQYLSHSFVESSDMMNIYNGNAILDKAGTAWVEMPDWFQALNQEFRYQLTPIGAPGPDLYIAQEIEGNRFQIAGGEPGMKVSWQVTGIRHDPYAENNRIPVEEMKPPDERGTYLYPQGYSQPVNMGLDYQKNTETEAGVNDEQ